MRPGIPSPAEAAQAVRAGLQVVRTEVFPRAERAVGVARARWLFRAFRVGQGVAAYGPVAARNDGHAELGDKLTFLGGMLPTSVVCYENARLVVGAQSQFNYGVSLEAWESVQIGARCMFASFVRVSDRDGQRIAPIIIEDDVWVAHGAILLPGVRIGARSVVSAGSIVSQDVPPDSLAMGNPARSMSLDLVAREASGA
ncbi:acyltransferase [Corallococcus sp. ZKHCc1 1396]|uniref:Acyltransferase n=1 Tax=Corallococcus soli TaxID=2710757 RepID=A0ABR9PXN5_9BACT|nr:MULTISPECIES: acyltransferase [Corallococcus]MBE4752696.1 acyltransferase [Corallococcus soli]MCY1034538.1 acyltransferase [Corallococcus sp. BB11-1]